VSFEEKQRRLDAYWEKIDNQEPRRVPGEGAQQHPANLPKRPSSAAATSRRSYQPYNQETRENARLRNSHSNALENETEAGDWRSMPNAPRGTTAAIPPPASHVATSRPKSAGHVVRGAFQASRSAEDPEAHANHVAQLLAQASQARSAVKKQEPQNKPKVDYEKIMELRRARKQAAGEAVGKSSVRRTFYVDYSKERAEGVGRGAASGEERDESWRRYLKPKPGEQSVPVTEADASSEYVMQLICRAGGGQPDRDIARNRCGESPRGSPRETPRDTPRGRPSTAGHASRPVPADIADRQGFSRPSTARYVSRQDMRTPGTHSGSYRMYR